MGKGHGFGKTILFGEHFVVYGLPALASAIGSKTEALVEKKASPGYELMDNRPEVSGYKDKKFDEQKVSIKKVLDFMGIDPNKVIDIENLSGHAGKPLKKGAKIATENDIINAIKTVEDPEIPVNLYDLGLIYEIKILKNGNVKINMTLTSPTCPIADKMPQMVADAVATIKDVGKIDVKVVWDPPWDISMISEEARFELDLL